jgi:formate hydrogenlyase transcriptional activator
MELSRAVNGDAFAKVVQLHRQLEKEQGCHAEVVGEWFSFADIIGKSAVLRAVLDQIQKVGPTDATVLLLGEWGTGKEVMASAIEQCSPRPSRLPVGVNCASVPDELFESEVFAHPAPSALPAVEQAASNNLMPSTKKSSG